MLFDVKLFIYYLYDGDRMELEIGSILKDIYKINKVIHISIVYLCDNLKENHKCIVKEYFPKSVILRDLDKKLLYAKCQD